VEFAKLVVSNSSLFASGWPESVKGVIGHKAFVFKDGVPHMSVKKLLQKAVLPETLKTQVPSLEEIIFKNINSWAEKGSIVAREGNDKVDYATPVFSLSPSQLVYSGLASLAISLAGQGQMLSLNGRYRNMIFSEL
jgi:hypothetical protein